MKIKSICFGFLLLGLVACGGQPGSASNEEDQQKATEVTIFQAKDSQNKWILHADEVDFEDMTRAVLTNPHLLLREGGKDSAEISGKRGIMDYGNKIVSIEGNARVHSLTQQVLLTTERFFYDIDKDHIWSDKKTIVTRGDTKITAKGGIETDSKLRKIEFKKQSTKLPASAKELQGVGR
ncbi:MAG: LPS export ABC transporter periplasmic protein LptC [Elusimicrobiaceae bacterium]|nr:LPS export ABC transporter periplasmic protein LptC [Elusimicrobiaceae bacterium]